MKIRIATRKSPLALWQAHYVQQKLLKTHPYLDISFVTLTTQGDREEGKALTEIGGKLLFVKELQLSLLNNQADLSVHSVKDLSAHETPGLKLAAICERTDPRDVFISKNYSSLMKLPLGSTVGTASPRRTVLLKSQRPDLTIKLLRGNIGTRLLKCERNEYDAIILAAAGLKRLELEHQINEYLDPVFFTPAIGQGALGVECRKEDHFCLSLVECLHHPKTAQCVNAERAVNQVLGGGCHSAIGAHATIQNNALQLRAMVGNLQKRTILRSKMTGLPEAACELGQAVAADLLDQGALSFLN